MITFEMGWVKENIKINFTSFILKNMDSSALQFCWVARIENFATVGSHALLSSEFPILRVFQAEDG